LRHLQRPPAGHHPRVPAPSFCQTARGQLSAKAGGDIKERITLLRREKVSKPTIFVGTGTCGLGAGAAKTMEAAKAYLAAKKLDAEVIEVGCLGMCSEEPMLDVQLPGKARVSFCRVTADRVSSVLDAALAGKVSEGLRARAVPQRDGRGLAERCPSWTSTRSSRRSCAGCSPTRASSIPATSTSTSPAAAIRRWKRPAHQEAGRGLRHRHQGRPARPWRRRLPHRREVEVRARRPGRSQVPHLQRRRRRSRRVHGSRGGRERSVPLARRHGHRGLRHRRQQGVHLHSRRVPAGHRALEGAIPKATEYGLLGKNILGSGFDLEIVLKLGAGAFVCGEETALMQSIEGKRGMPRPRPPFPAVSGPVRHAHGHQQRRDAGLRSRPDGNGRRCFAAVGTAKSKGTKVFALSGMVNRTGLVEVPMGTTIREIVFAVGGGIPNGKKCKAVQIGGPSGGCIPEPKMDIIVDYDAIKELGAIMGSGGLVVLDENTCMVDLAKFFMEFIGNESCGKCIPCREGTKRMLEILQAITRPRRRENGSDALLRFQGVMQLKQLAETIRISSLCGLGQTAPNPVLSTMRWFRDEYEAHIFDRACPAGTCKELVGAPCQTGCPVGTEVWRYVAHIARGETELAYQAIRDANPFPSVCARVCSHPCEEVCRCGATGGEPIAVRALKRYVVDHIDPKSYTVTIKPATDKSKKVAVIGAGPSGLTTAHYLSQKGHKVTVFEKENEPGGMLFNGIPAYRLPRDVVRKEIASLLNANIELKCNIALGQGANDITVDGLMASGFDAVYVSIGAYKSQRLGIDGEDVAGVIPGMAFLKANNLRDEKLAKGNVGIIGGGNTAMDAARVALRQPGVKKVTILYRRTRDEMPAFAEEIHAALEEGIELKELVAPWPCCPRTASSRACA
jgi:NADH:ubiquinone oxidoreductase subunit F (NADH-binding)/(2Fe-2S) ferredoxin